ncbi:MAG: peptidoglycan glycosyltransferase, partial [Phaeodactylibacter sp.]|nr:peptidoglycan glycosyltransferase [Phaeodactylibacter sp.]
VTTRRQVGSTFKPFVYATAIKDVGISPCFRIYDLPQTIYPGEGNFNLQEEWTPANASGKYSGEYMTIKDGLRQSINTVSVYLMKQLQDTEPVRDLADRMGIDKNAKYPNGRFVLPHAPSICLGATDLSVIEMAGAYTTFANNGHYSAPFFITRIEDRAGREIYKDASIGKDALDPRHNYVMVHMLQYAATGLGGLKSQVGGKTGTTNDFVDGWFMGITPSLVIGTWVGGEDRWIRFRNLLYGQGSYMAKPYFKRVLERLENDESADYDVKAQFYVPQGDIGIELDCSKVPGNSNNGADPYEGFEEADPYGDEDLPPLDSSSFQFNAGSGGGR